MARSPRLIAATSTPHRPFPAWARFDARLADAGEVAFAAGAALAVLSVRVRADAPWAGVWRRRLALNAAVASCKLVRRSEDDGMLRDAFYLRRPADDPGPAGKLLVAWRGLDCSAPLDDGAALAAVVAFGLNDDDALRTTIVGARSLIDRGSPFPQPRGKFRFWEKSPPGTKSGSREAKIKRLVPDS